MRTGIRLILLTLTSVILGTVFFAGSLRVLSNASSVRNGDWSTNTSTGSADAGLHQRAYIALVGLLASQRTDSVYYTLNQVDGRPLRLNCDYVLRGADMDADWWSITAYGVDSFLIPNEHRRYSFNNANTQRNADHGFTLKISQQPQVGNWLPTGPSGGTGSVVEHEFDLTLRLYTPGDAYLQHPESAPVPRVERLECR